MKKKTIYIIVLVALLIPLTYFFNKSNCVLPEEYKTQSLDIGLLTERQGMITYDVHLRSDGKFICNNDGSYIFGKYHYALDTISLFTVCDQQNLLCSKYYIDTTKDLGGYLLAIPQCIGSCKNKKHEELWFDWNSLAD